MTPGKVLKIRIPTGSLLVIQASPTEEPDTWDAEAEIRKMDSAELVQYTNAQLRAGTELKLEGIRPARYTGQLRLRYPGESSARVQILVRKPDGEPHGEDYDFVHSGPVADLISISLYMD